MIGVRRVRAIPTLHHRLTGCFLSFEIADERHFSSERELEPIIRSAGGFCFCALVIQLGLRRHTEIPVGFPLELELRHA